MDNRGLVFDVSLQSLYRMMKRNYKTTEEFCKRFIANLLSVNDVADLIKTIGLTRSLQNKTCVDRTHYCTRDNDSSFLSCNCLLYVI